MEQQNIPELIEYYSKRNILISVLPDGYKFLSVGICWRCIVIWSDNGMWYEEDCGCSEHYLDVFNNGIEFINACLQNNLK